MVLTWLFDLPPSFNPSATAHSIGESGIGDPIITGIMGIGANILHGLPMDT